ncbi:MAG TPA: LUD domain-containing protein [Fimbriimonadaceae bacterium]|nr:LUD domain-containing protein [Fimbriimonadaceae bacterium]
MSDRERILSVIGGSTGVALPSPWPGPSLEGALENRFESELKTLGAELVTADRLKELAGASVFADSDVPEPLLRGLVRTEDVWSADLGITLADYGIADTGSLLLTAGPGRNRLASLAPPHHIAVLSRTRILDTAEAAIEVLPSRTAVIVSGPSRTADIEGVIVRGIHGPRRLWVLLTD